MLFDPQTVARGPKRRAHDLPAGAARLTASAVGLHGTWINGTPVADARGFCADPKEPTGRSAALLRGLNGLPTASHVRRKPGRGIRSWQPRLPAFDPKDLAESNATSYPDTFKALNRPALEPPSGRPCWPHQHSA
jgi:hypothetical protein